MVWLCIPYSFLVFALAVAFGHPWGKRATRFTAAALVKYGIVSTAGLLLFPMDVRGTVASQRDGLHIIGTIVMSIFIVAMMAFGAFAHGMRLRGRRRRHKRVKEVQTDVSLSPTVLRNLPRTAAMTPPATAPGRSSRNGSTTVLIRLPTLLMP